MCSARRAAVHCSACRSAMHLLGAVEGADAAEAGAGAAHRRPSHHRRRVLFAGRRLPGRLGGVEAVQPRELRLLEVQPLQDLVVRRLRARCDVACSISTSCVKCCRVRRAH